MIRLIVAAESGERDKACPRPSRTQEGRETSLELVIPSHCQTASQMSNSQSSLPSPSPDVHPAQCITINPIGRGATNTINRAELSAFGGALDTLQETRPLHADGSTHTIAPDSAPCMYKIRRALLSPMDLRWHTHKAAQDTILHPCALSSHMIPPARSAS